MPVGKTKMGFIDIAKMLVFWTLLEGEIARLQVVVIKEELHFLSLTTQSLVFIFHFKWEKERSNSAATCFLPLFFLKYVFSRGNGIQENKLKLFNYILIYLNLE